MRSYNLRVDADVHRCGGASAYVPTPESYRPASQLVSSVHQVASARDSKRITLDILGICTCRGASRVDCKQSKKKVMSGRQSIDYTPVVAAPL